VEELLLFSVAEGVPAQGNQVAEMDWIWIEYGEVHEAEVLKVRSKAHGNCHCCIDFVRETVDRSLGFHFQVLSE
jgi:coenzyme F420-reducing hydrogenase beta subunit